MLSGFLPRVLCEGMSLCAQHPYSFFKSKGIPKLKQVNIDQRFEPQVSEPALNTNPDFPLLFIFLHIVFPKTIIKILFTFKISNSLKWVPVPAFWAAEQWPCVGISS